MQELDGETLLARGASPGNTVPLRPGISHATLNDPGERWTLTDVTCRETDETLLSIGDADAMTAVLGVDPDDKITCTFKLRDETVPQAGSWIVEEVSQNATCKGQPVDLEPGPTRTYQLAVRNKGRRLIGSGAGGGISLTRKASDDGHYSGRSRGAKLDYITHAHDHMTGRSKLQKRGCTFIRRFDMRRLGD